MQIGPFKFGGHHRHHHKHHCHGQGAQAQAQTDPQLMQMQQQLLQAMQVQNYMNAPLASMQLMNPSSNPLYFG